MTVARLIVFGDVLPNTFWAKSGGTSDQLVRWAVRTCGTATAASRWRRSPCWDYSTTRPTLRYLATIPILWSAYFLWSGGDFYAYARVFTFLAPLAYYVGLSALAARIAPGPAFGWRHAAPLVAAVVLAAAGHGFRDRYAPPYENVARWSATGEFLAKCFPGATVAAGANWSTGVLFRCTCAGHVWTDGCEGRDRWTACFGDRLRGGSRAVRCAVDARAAARRRILRSRLRTRRRCIAPNRASARGRARDARRDRVHRARPT